MEVKGGRPPTRTAEQIDVVRLQAREAVLEWSRLAVVNIEEMGSRAQDVCKTLVDRGVIDMRERNLHAYRQRTAMIEEAAVWVTTTLGEARLNDDNRAKVTSYVTQLFDNLANKEDERTRTIEAGLDTRRSQMEAAESQSKKTIYDRKAFVKSKLTDNEVLRLSVVGLEEKMASLTRRSGEIFGERERAVKGVVDEKLKGFNTLLNNKEIELKSSIQNLRSQVEARIRSTLQAQQNQETRDRQRSQQANGNGQRSQQSGTGNEHKHRGDQTSQQSQDSSPDPRISRLMGGTTGVPVKPYVTVLGNIDHHRAKGKTDEQIYKLLVKHFHPDMNPDSSSGEDVLKVLTEAYNKTTKTFKV